MTIDEKRQEITDLIHNIKEHADRLNKSHALPILELSVILSKISRLYEQTVLLKYLLKVEGGWIKNDGIQFLEDDIAATELAIEALGEKQAEATATDTDETVEATDALTTAEIAEEKEENLDEAAAEAVAEMELDQEEEEVAEQMEATAAEEETAVANMEVLEAPPLVASEEEMIEEIEHLAETELGASQDINSRFAEGDDPSLSNQLKKQPIDDLFAAIGLNERYQFSNELFGGNMEAFREAVQQLNACSNGEEAMQMFREKYANVYSWEIDNQTVEEFRQLVERRFY